MPPAIKDNLQGPRLLLREPRDGDVADRLALGNTPEIQRMFGADPAQTRELTEDAARGWVEFQKREAWGWIIDLDGRCIGNIRLHTLNLADERANMAIAILDPDLLGQGLGGEAMRLVADYAFGPMGLHRLSMRVLSFNTRAIAAYRKLGFVEEGVERESALIGGTRHDDIIMGLLARDFTGAP